MERKIKQGRDGEKVRGREEREEEKQRGREERYTYEKREVGSEGERK